MANIELVYVFLVYILLKNCYIFCPVLSSSYDQFQITWNILCINVFCNFLIPKSSLQVYSPCSVHPQSLPSIPATLATKVNILTTFGLELEVKSGILKFRHCCFSILSTTCSYTLSLLAGSSPQRRTSSGLEIRFSRQSLVAKPLTCDWAQSVR